MLLSAGPSGREVDGLACFLKEIKQDRTVSRMR